MMISYKVIFRIVLSILFIALFAQLSIDLPLGQTDIPITGQTFAVLLVGYFLGAKWSAIAVSLYVTAGLIGLPVFADGNSGIDVLSGGSGGYLIGFIAGAAVVGWMCSKRKTPTFLNALVLMAMGTIVILIFGVGRLMHIYGMEKGLEYGLYPFWKGAIIKVILGALVAWLFERKKKSRMQAVD